MRYIVLSDVNAKALWFVLCLRKLGKELHDFSRTLVEVLVDFAKVTDFLYVSILSHIESQTVKKMRFVRCFLSCLKTDHASSEVRCSSRNDADIDSIALE